MARSASIFFIVKLPAHVIISCMIKKFFIIILLLSSSLVFAEGSIKQKTFGTFTIRFDTQKPELVITNAEDRTLVPKEYLENDKDSESEGEEEKPKSLAKKNLKKRTADDFTYADCELDWDDE